jgi:hypothetical protein
LLGGGRERSGSARKWLLRARKSDDAFKKTRTFFRDPRVEPCAKMTLDDASGTRVRRGARSAWGPTSTAAVTAASSSSTPWARTTSPDRPACVREEKGRGTSAHFLRTRHPYEKDHVYPEWVHPALGNARGRRARASYLSDRSRVRSVTTQRSRRRARVP